MPLMHHLHHVPQKSRRTYFPLNDSRVMYSPSRFLSLKSGTWYPGTTFSQFCFFRATVSTGAAAAAGTMSVIPTVSPAFASSAFFPLLPHDTVIMSAAAAIAYMNILFMIFKFNVSSTN